MVDEDLVKEMIKMKSQIGELYGHIHDIELDQRDFKKDLKDLIEKVDRYNFDDFDSDIDNLKSKSEDVQDMIAELNERLPDVDISDMYGKIDDMETNIRDIFGKTEDLESSLDDVSGNLDDLDSRVTDVEGKVDKTYELESVVDNLQVEVENELKKEFEEMKTNFISYTELQGDVLDLSSKVEDINAFLFPKSEELIVDAIIEEEENKS